MEIKGIIFDLGKVLIDFSFDPFYDWIEKHSHRNPREVFKNLIKNKIIQNYELGLITSKEFFSCLKKELEFDVSIETIQFLWNDIFSPIPENIQLLHKLVQNKLLYNIKIVLLSNTNESHKQYIEEQYKIFNLFDHCIFSYEIHLEKPQKEIYEYTLNQIQLRPEQTIFIDDKIENIEGARNLGIHCIHYTRDINLEEVLKHHFFIKNFSLQKPII